MVRVPPKRIPTTDPDSARWAEERLKLAVDAAGLGPWEWDVQNGKVFWSPNLEDIHGIPRGSFAGTFEAWKRDIHPDDLERVLATVRDGLESRRGHEMEYRIVRPDGELRWLEVRSRLHCDEDGRPQRVFGVCLDVTDRKRLEDARELFIAMLGHDLKDPLQAIHTASLLIAQHQTAPPTLLKAAGVVTRSVERMDHIIHDLLDFARGRFGQGMPVDRRPMSMDAVCRRVLDEVLLAHPGSAVKLDVAGDLDGEWDAERVGQAAANLFANALTHGEGRAEIELRGDAEDVVLTVANGGPPIPAETLPRLFEPFYSSSVSRSNLGLGLFITDQVVRAHAGRIAVTSSAQDGTRFTVHWPRRPAAFRRVAGA